MTIARPQGGQIAEDLELEASRTPSVWNDSASNPHNWSPQRKWTITAFSCFLSLVIGINALSVTSTAEYSNRDLDIDDEHFANSYLYTVTTWNLGAMVGPVLGLPLMENFGVKKIYLISYIIFVIFVIPQAVAQTSTTMIVTRFFGGIFGSIGQNAVANVIGDLFVGKENTFPSIMFLWAYITGFTLGPVFGSSIVEFLNWRWVFYIQLIIYGLLIPPSWLLIRETRGAVLRSTRRGSSASTEPIKASFWTLLYDGTVRPLRLFFTEPVLFSFVLWVTLAISNVFIATQTIGQTYGANWGFNYVQSGYVEGAMVIGELIGLGFSLLQGRLYLNSAKKNTERPGTPIPEALLTLSAPLSIFGTAAGLFIYGWTNYSTMPWIAPTIGLALTGAGIQVVNHSGVAYVIDAYGDYAGSAVAAFAFVENLLSAFLPLSSMSMYSTSGFQWASSLLGFFALILSLAPLILYFNGPKIRARSKFMSSL